MSIWILAILLFGLIAALGYLQGAVRLTVSLIGLFLGVLLAVPLSPAINPILGWFGVTHAVWKWVLPPIIVFLLVWFVFIGVSFFVHRKVDLYFKYRADDVDRFRFQRLNQRLGVSLGVVMAVVWLYLLTSGAYALGHLTTQVSDEDPGSTGIRLVNNVKRDLHETGFVSSAASFDPLPRNFYQISDILGLIRHNPAILSRLSQYPPFLALAEREEFQEIATDSEYNTLLQSKADIAEIIRHPKTQAILRNDEIMQELLAQDFNDLRQFLETGNSPKFEDENILGRWKLDMYATIAQERKNRPNMKSSDMIRLKKMLTEMMPDVTLVARPDKKVVLKVEMTEAMKQLAESAAARAQAAQPDAYGMSPELAQRYRPGRPAVPQDSGEQAATPQPANQMVYAGEGTWENEAGDRYQVTIQDERGKSETLPVTADDEKLLVRSPLVTMVFYKDE